MYPIGWTGPALASGTRTTPFPRHGMSRSFQVCEGVKELYSKYHVRGLTHEVLPDVWLAKAFEGLLTKCSSSRSLPRTTCTFPFYPKMEADISILKATANKDDGKEVDAIQFN